MPNRSLCSETANYLFQEKLTIRFYYFILFLRFNRAQPFLHVLDAFARGARPPILGKDSILISPLGWCNEVYEHDDPKKYAFLALHQAFGRMTNLFFPKGTNCTYSGYGGNFR